MQKIKDILFLLFGFLILVFSLIVIFPIFVIIFFLYQLNRFRKIFIKRKDIKDEYIKIK